AGDLNVFPACFASESNSFFQRHLTAEAGELHQDWEIDSGDDLDLGLVHDRDGEVRGRAAEHIGEDDDAGTRVGAAHGFKDVGPARDHIVLGTNGDRLEL